MYIKFELCDVDRHRWWVVCGLCISSLTATAVRSVNT